MLKFVQVQADDLRMIGSVSPGDIMQAMLAGRRAEALDREIAKAGRAAPKYSMQQVSALETAERIRPEYALMSLMDRNRDAAEDRKTGKSPRSAFDDLISAKVAATLSPVYAGEGAATPDLAAADPFSAGTTIGRISPKIRPATLDVLKNAGYPTELLFDKFSNDPLSSYLQSISSRSKKKQSPSASSTV